MNVGNNSTESQIILRNIGWHGSQFLPLSRQYNQDPRRKSAKALTHLEATVRALGRNTLGFGPDDVGPHSILSGTAMVIYLGSVPVFTIILIGRWSSDAFLHYTLRQVQEFNQGVSA
jgi:hypothetical protein